ncbi:MAG: hypothetical protein IPK00_05470 [Deltaproteobacteria bacterium]|nr:hypothetical protein [Deltaproteobacteria bacterium]
MPIDQQLLAILICPESGQPLALAEPPLLAKLNAEIRAERLRNRCGEVLKKDIREGLVREDGRFLYVIDDDIPIMLIDQSIELA